MRKGNTKMKILEYTDPHPSGGIQITRMTKQQAIDWTKQLHPELTEEQALEDFIVAQWAYWVEEHTPCRTCSTKKHPTGCEFCNERTLDQSYKKGDPSGQ